MSYQTKKILRDAQGNPIPQLFNPDIDDFEPLYGQNGSQRVLLRGPNDEPLLTDTNPGKVEVTNTVNTQLTGSIGQQAFQYRRTDSFAPGEEYTVLDTTTPVIIDDIDWFPRHEIHALLQIGIHGIGVNFINELGTGVRSWINPDMVKKGVGLYWGIITYDTTVTPDPLFRFRLRKSLYCPKGILIKLRNSDAEKTFRNSIDVRGRELL